MACGYTHPKKSGMKKLDDLKPKSGKAPYPEAHHAGGSKIVKSTGGKGGRPPKVILTWPLTEKEGNLTFKLTVLRGIVATPKK